jgi:hypothetical protein
MKLLQQMLFLDERTDKFSTSKFMLLMNFYVILFINIKALYLNTDVKNASFLTECLMITSSLYFGRKFNMKNKDIEVSGDQTDAK